VYPSKRRSPSTKEHAEGDNFHQAPFSLDAEMIKMRKPIDASTDICKHSMFR
jgi:hypothetical protein